MDAPVYSTAHRLGVMVLSRDQAERWAPREHHIVISISGSDGDDPSDRPRLARSAERLGVLCLQFDALDSDVEGFQRFDDKMARAVLDFVGMHLGGANLLVVHCEQGRNRSPAIAAAICRLLGGHDAAIWRRTKPCKNVYDKLLAVAHEEQWPKSID